MSCATAVGGARASVTTCARNKFTDGAAKIIALVNLLLMKETPE